MDEATLFCQITFTQLINDAFQAAINLTLKEYIEMGNLAHKINDFGLCIIKLCFSNNKQTNNKRMYAIRMYKAIKEQVVVKIENFFYEILFRFVSFGFFTSNIIRICMYACMYVYC